MSIFKQQEPETVTVSGHLLVCPICAAKHFFTNEVIMNTGIATFFRLD